MTFEAACDKVLLLLTMTIDIVFTVCQLRMLAQMVDMMYISCASVLARCFAVLTFVMLIVQYLVPQLPPFPVVIEVRSTSGPYQLPYLVSGHSKIMRAVKARSAMVLRVLSACTIKGHRTFDSTVSHLRKDHNMDEHEGHLPSDAHYHYGIR